MNTERVLQTAENYIGFRSRGLRTNNFGAKAGHNTEIWSGSFVQVVLRETDNYFPVHFSNTTAALSYARLRNLTVRAPQPGDVVFYTFPTDESLAQPHVGIVTDVEKWKKQGIFQAIEGETAPNSSRKHPQPADGVWKRTRYATEVLEFVRMHNWKAGNAKNALSISEVDHEFTPLGRGKHVETVQKALEDVFGSRIRSVRKGVWDAPTSHAYSQWQRFTGYAVTGVPDSDSLMFLGVETGRWVG